MFGSHFYHATMRKSVAVFGTLFNNISVVRKDGTGSVVNQIKVPLAYGPKQKFLSRIENETGKDASVAIKLPRMAFEITGVDLDSTQKLNKMAVVSETSSEDSTKKNTIKHMVAYNIGMQLNVLAKNQDEGLQIVEQILPYFQPEYTVSIRPVDGFEHKQDVPIILTGVSISDEYEGEFSSRRVLVYTLDFTMKMKFYGPTQEQGVIREINLDFINMNTSQALEEMDITIDPSDASPDDDYTVDVTIGW